MKRKIGTYLSFTAVLALLAVLAVLSAGSVSALTGVTATPSPVTVTSSGQYTVAFTAGTSGALVEDIGTITVTFPSGTVVPATIQPGSVSVNGFLLTHVGSGNAPAAPLVSGQSVTITVPQAIANSASVSVFFAQSAGIMNPNKGTTSAKVKVKTSAENTDVDSAAYTIRPTITRSPTSGPKGTVVTVTGTGFSSSLAVDLSFGSLGVIGSTTADSNGAFSTTITVPSNASPGANTLSVTDGAGLATDPANVVSFTVSPSMTASPSSAVGGTTVTLTGTEFTPLTHITAVTMGSTNILSSLLPARTPAAGANPGTKHIGATHATVLTDTETDFTIAGAGPVAVGDVVINLTEGASGVITALTATTVTVAALTGGTGNNQWDAGEDYFIHNVKTAATTGAIPSGTTIKIPGDSTPGAKTLTVTAGSSANLTYTVTARTINQSVSTGVPGSKVSLNGTGMTASGTITANSITFGGGTNTATHAVVNIASDGSWNITDVVVPDGVPTGAIEVKATDSGGRIATSTFNVTARTATLTPTSGIAGSSVVINGSGFKKGATVDIQWPTGTAFKTTTANDFGDIALAFDNPEAAVSNDKTVEITACVTTSPNVCGNIKAAASFTLPGAAITVSPTSAAVGQQVTISGTGFGKYANVTPMTIGAANVLPPTGLMTDATGKFTATVTVPGMNTGGATVSTTVGTVTETANLTVTAAPTTISSVLSPLGTNLVRVWGYNPTSQAFQLYDPAAPAIANDLAALTKGQGYWIRVTSNQTLVVGVNSYNLVAGWNLIGWLG